VLRSTDAGKVVTCIELIGDSHITAANGPVWLIDRDCMWADWSRGGLETPLPYCPDSALLPIRPQADQLDEEPMTNLSDMDVLA
jgi:hypothetical protein